MRPILEGRFPSVGHAAALIGTGSEVLGFDDSTSSDRYWGLRIQLFLGDLGPAAEIESALAHELPTAFGGYSTSFGSGDQVGVRLLVPVESAPRRPPSRAALAGRLPA